MFGVTLDSMVVHCSMTCVLSLLGNYDMESMDKAEVTGVVFLDMKLSLDMVDHNF